MWTADAERALVIVTTIYENRGLKADTQFCMIKMATKPMPFGMKYVRGTGIVNESKSDGDPGYVELAKPYMRWEALGRIGTDA